MEMLRRMMRWLLLLTLEVVVTTKLTMLTMMTMMTCYQLEYNVNIPVSKLYINCEIDVSLYTLYFVFYHLLLFTYHVSAAFQNR